MKLANWLLTAAVMMMAACGGSDGAPPPAPGPAPTIAVSGTAATGAPLASAAVSLLCADGGPPVTATTSTEGKYNMTLPATCSAPYMLKVEAAGLTLYAFADAAGNINITPFTHLAAGLATGNNTAAEYEAVRNGVRKVSALWNASSDADARARLAAFLTAHGVSTAGVTDLLHAVFDAKPGNPLDNALEALRTTQGGVPLEDTLETIAQAGGRIGNKPWLTIFPAGQTSVSYAVADCTYQFTASRPPVTMTSGTVTLTIEGDTLVTRLAASGSERTADMKSTIGGTLSQFTLTANRRGEGFVDITASTYAGSGSQLRIRPSETIEPFLYVDSHGALMCDTIPSPPTVAQLRAFSVPARMAALIAPRETDLSGLCFPETAYEYRYALTPSGNMSIGDTSFAANPLTQQYFWDERTFWGPVPEADLREFLWGSTEANRGFFVSRTSSNLSQSCGPFGAPT